MKMGSGLDRLLPKRRKKVGEKAAQEKEKGGRKSKGTAQGEGAVER
ncbi:MAG: hypothetical protein JRJ00_14210 [Deltaproteobacteria bacterium]|nr:hypothetical protein [Deltaproteobacteria bacterium]